MFFLIAVVVLLIVITYSMDSERGESRSQGRSSRRNPFQGRFKNSTDGRAGHSTIDKGQLMRCHQCSSFFPPKRVVSMVIDGHILEFCSENCRNHFVNSLKT